MRPLGIRRCRRFPTRQWPPPVLLQEPGPRKDSLALQIVSFLSRLMQKVIHSCLGRTKTVIHKCPVPEEQWMKGSLRCPRLFGHRCLVLTGTKSPGHCRSTVCTRTRVGTRDRRTPLWRITKRKCRIFFGLSRHVYENLPWHQGALFSGRGVALLSRNLAAFLALLLARISRTFLPRLVATHLARNLTQNQTVKFIHHSLNNYFSISRLPDCTVDVALFGRTVLERYHTVGGWRAPEI